MEKGQIVENIEGKFRISSDYSEESSVRVIDSNERTVFIISRLLADDQADIFNLADELYVSDATIQADLKKVRRKIEPFDLTLVNSNSLLSLKGSEKNKRSLTSYMISNTRYRGFMFDDGNQFFDNDYQIESLKHNLVTIFNECSFYYNDYSLNNIILHLIITIDRLRNHYSIEETQISLHISSIEIEAADKISNYLESCYDIEINATERNNIASFLAVNLAALDYRLINRQNVSSYIDPSTIELVDYILQKISDYYLLDSFDDVFFARFSLHIDNLLKRQKINSLSLLSFFH